MVVGAIGIEATRPLGQLPRQPVPSKLHEVDGGCGCACERSRRGRQGDGATGRTGKIGDWNALDSLRAWDVGASFLSQGSGQLEGMRRRKDGMEKAANTVVPRVRSGFPVHTSVPSMVLQHFGHFTWL